MAESKINWMGVLKGGLLAGLFVNISEIVLNTVVRPVPEESGGNIVVWIAYAFVLGLGIAAVYAAIRPRCGAGASTGAWAGLTVWFFHGLMPSVAVANMGLFPLDLLTVAWTAAEGALAGVIAGRFYSE